jgi:hypothetical protein
MLGLRCASPQGLLCKLQKLKSRCANRVQIDPPNAVAMTVCAATTAS